MIDRFTMNLRSTAAEEADESDDRRVSTLIFGCRSRTPPSMLDRHTGGIGVVEGQFSSTAGTSSFYELDPVRE
jgi:hypothetical protein